MMLHVANLRPGNRVLDVAAGTGDQTLMAARRVGPTGYVLATDISANMLKLASDAAREADLTNVETRVMDAENLDLDANSFDSAICRQGLMLFSNPVKALVEMRRVVKPTGKVGALVWSSEEKNPYQAFPSQSFAASENSRFRPRDNLVCSRWGNRLFLKASSGRPVSSKSSSMRLVYKGDSRPPQRLFKP
jgi:ubiquinone/menaquinone biosynthesis C-methylase UbiE